jgi:hypothetical protein
VRAACESLIGTKHDIFTELWELDDLLSAPTTPDSLLASRIVRWLGEPLAELHQTVILLEEQAFRDSVRAAGYLLVAGSAVNIYPAFDAAKGCAESLFDGTTDREH